MVDQFELTNLLIKNSDQFLALLSQLIKSVLFFEDARFGLAATSAFDGSKAVGRVLC